MTYIEQITECVEALANTEQLRSIWLGEHERFVSSPGEDLNIVFDDLGLRRRAEELNPLGQDLKGRVLSLFEEFNRVAARYDYSRPEELLRDKDFNALQDVAKQLLADIEPVKRG